jgi:hypothetical protein
VGVFPDELKDHAWSPYCEGIRSVKQYREEHGVPLAEVPTRETHRSLYDFYAKYGGDADTPLKEIVAHTRSRFGPPCPRCGKERYSQTATTCIECGAITE